MTSPYEKGFVNNVFQQMDVDSSLCVLGLCLASHDMAWHHTLISNSEAEEASYHFAASLSILREVAQIIKRIDDLSLKAYFTQETSGMLEDLKRNLMPFQEDSLTKGSLKPIRDLTFHYDFIESDHKKRMASLLDEMKKEQELRVRASSGDNSIRRYRYTFADAFRSKLVTSYLTKDIVEQITITAVKVIAFTDSLLADLSG